MAQLLQTDFFVMALAAGLLLALITGPLGAFIVWRRMAYFGDTLAHSALLGIALGLLGGIEPQWAIVVTGIACAVLLTALDRRPALATDTLLGILAHSSLALGVLALALTGSAQVNIETYLFGSLLTMDGGDLVRITVMAAAVGVVLLANWNALLAVTVQADLAQVEGHSVTRAKFTLITLTALTVAMSINIVGVLLITSLLIIPPAAARRLATTPEQMAAGASLVACLAVVAGLLAAFWLDVPVGPAIVAVATLLFLALQALPSPRRG